MKTVSRALVLASLVAFGTVVGARAADEPLETDMRESVRAELAQVEVTVWPTDDSAAQTCRGFTEKDFQLQVNGRLRAIRSVDWLGSALAMQAREAEPVPDPERPPLTLVLLFDLWHLNLFFRAYECPVTKPLAFEEARRMVREEFREGDRLLLVTFAGWPVIHEGWIREPEQALRALDRLEVNPFVVSARRDHSHHNGWIDGVESLLLALGRYPGRKEIIYLADDFRFDDVALRAFELAARAQSNQVSMHAFDLLSSCRSVPGPPCTEAPGGLGCTPYRVPLALGYVSANTGGELFTGSRTLAESVRRIREMRGCCYLISFPVRSRKRAPRVKVLVSRDGFRLRYPSSFAHPDRAPRERDEQDALFLLPRFGAGLAAEIGLWPLRPTGKKNRWKSLMIARLRRVPSDPWPDGVTRLEIEAAAHRGSKVYGEYRKVITGEELRLMRDEGLEKLMVFPVDGVRPGLNSVAMRVLGVGGDVSAVVRNFTHVPDPPGPGEARPWFLTDRLARVGSALTLMPTLDGVVRSGSSAMIVGYGCRGEQPEFGNGKLIGLDRNATLPIAIDWLDPADDNDVCGWLVGRTPETMDPGLWRFEPPGALEPRDAPEAGDDAAIVHLEFRVE